MKKKLFTLLTLLCLCVTGAWAADFTETFTTLGSVTGSYAANGISKIALGKNASVGSAIKVAKTSSSTTDGVFTISAATGFTIKSVTFDTKNIGAVTCDDTPATTVVFSDNSCTYTASSNISSVQFTATTTSNKEGLISNIVITTTSSSTDDYELITPSSASETVISYTSSLGDDKLVTGMNTIGDGVSVSSGSIDFGNGKGFSITTSRAIKSVYCVWYQRVPTANDKWTGYSESTYENAIGTYTLSTNAWVAPNSNTKYVAFKRGDGSTAKISRIHIFYYASTVPIISASNVSVFENTASAGEIDFTVNKLGTTGTVSAATAAGWVTLGDVDNVNGKAPFTVTANTTGDYRTATVTLTYTYDTSETVTRDVTVTQSPDFSGTEIVKLVLKNTVSGTIGGEADVLAQDRDNDNGGCKLGSKGHYAGITLDHNETFKAGDIVEVNIGHGGGGKFIFYDDNVATNALLTTDITPAAGTYTFVLPAAVNGHSSIYLVRGTTSDKNDGFNPYVDYISVTRPNRVVTLNASGFATFSNAEDFEFYGADAYKMALAATATTITLEGTKVTDAIPAGEGILFKGTAGDPVYIVNTTNAPAITGNNLHATTTADHDVVSMPSDKTILVLDPAGDTFKVYTGNAFAANKAYFQMDGTNVESRTITMTFDDGSTTAIRGIEEVAPVTMKTRKVVKNGRLVIETANGEFTIDGARVK